MNRRHFFAISAASLAALVAVPFFSSAQGQYPDRSIRLIVPFAPGGVVDVVARLWGEQVKGPLGTVVVENHAGGGGVIGASEVSRAQPDGYTILLGNTSTQVLNPAIMANPPYDPAKAFQTVSILANSAVSIAVNPNVPAKTLAELTAHIKANPGKLSYGSPGAGTFTHLAGEMYKQLAGTPDLTHIPYRGAGPGISDLVSGHIPAMFLNITNQVIELHKSGKIRIVAVLTPKRLDVLPDVPTGTETLPNLVAMLFTGLFVPAGTPAAVIDRIAQANRAAMNNAEYKAKLVGAGMDPVSDTPAEAQRFVDAERDRLVPLVKSTGFKPG
jgi:tripartite-type tricarboxylate transporter receptor subunit TctC